MTTNGLPDSPETQEAGLPQAEEKVNRLVRGAMIPGNWVDFRVLYCPVLLLASSSDPVYASSLGGTVLRMGWRTLGLENTSHFFSIASLSPAFLLPPHLCFES